MSLVSQISALATRIAQEIQAVRAEMTGNVDGGDASTNYAGATTLDGGSASGT